MATIRLIPSTYYLSNSSYLSVANAANMYSNTDDDSYATVTNSRTSTTSYYIYLRGFNFDAIPDGAIINSFTVKLKARESGVSTSSSYKPYLANGTSAINGSCDVITTTVGTKTFTGISADWETIKGYGANFGIRINCRRASRNTTGYMYIYGAEILVDYTMPVYHTVTVNGNNVSPSGAVSVLEGDSLRVKVYETARPTVTDNGVDVSSQLQQGQDAPESYSVANVTTSYGFALNGNGYYESNNQGRASSCALARVSFHMPVSGTITFSLINYAEATYDYGLLSNIDEQLSTNASADSSHVYWSGQNHNSASVQTVTYHMDAGDHTIDVKYFKDQYTDANNDSLQFKTAITLDETPSYDTYWYYDLTNITADHVINVTASGNQPKLWFKDPNWTQAIKAWKKVGNTWVEQTDLTTVFQSGVNYRKGN